MRLKSESGSARPRKTGGERTPLTERILGVLKAVPKGRVATYGQVAALAGSPRGARQVARLLHALSARENLPWHRVIGASGRISLPMEGGGREQARLLRKERVAVSPEGAVGLDLYQWRP